MHSDCSVAHRDLFLADSALVTSPANVIRVLELAASVDFILTFFISSISSHKSSCTDGPCSLHKLVLGILENAAFPGTIFRTQT